MKTITDKQQFGVAAKFESKAGNPVGVDGAPAWSVSDETILGIEVDPADPTKATVKAKGPIGTAQVRLTADADRGEGVREITALLDVEVLASDAVVALVSDEPAVDQPEPVTEPAPAP